MFRNKLLLALALLIGFVVQANAASGTIYVDNSTCATGATHCSGTSDSNTVVVSGTGATWATGVNSITLDTNTNLEVAGTGCSAGTCDGSQAIYLTNATNTNRKIFWLASYTGCTGSGACVLVVDVAPTCATCTAQDWGIGGHYTWPSGSTQNVVTPALRGGDTLQFNNAPAGRTAIYFTPVLNGTAGTYIKVIGKVGVDHPLLSVTGNATVIGDGGFSNWWFENLSIQSTSTTTSAIALTGAATVIKNIKVLGTGVGTANCISTTSATLLVLDSELTACGADGINNTATTGVYVGNYIHGNTGDGIELNVANPNIAIINNIVSANGGRGIYLSGLPSTQSLIITLMNNTIYANTSANIEVADADTRVLLRNVISQNATANSVNWAAGNAQAVSIHDHNDFYGAGGINGLTTNSTETTSDPLLSNPGSGAFVITSASPAAGTGQPGTILGTSTGYLDMGAVQHQGGGGASCIGC